MNVEAVLAALESAPKPSHITYSYGTAGFRMKNDANQLDSAILRSALLACARSCVHGGRAVGVMITASHNSEPDNGAKLCEPDGEMLAAEWEPVAVELANCADAPAALAVLRRICPVDANPPRVFVARDTRRSSEHLVSLVARAVRAFHPAAVLHDCGLQTTPQLHHFVRAHTAGAAHGEAEYYELLASAFLDVVGGAAAAVASPLRIVVDCAFGVGSLQLRKLAARVDSRLLVLAPINEAGQGELNAGCGAEHVQKALQLPANVAPGTAGCFAALDGDADRIVFFGAQRGGLLLCDGDKIACLIAAFVREQLRQLPPTLAARVGVVQTAYANGGAARFVRDVLGVELAVVKTGVKYLHHQAHAYDVGVYFEANGHGTVLFAPAFLERLRALPESAPRTALLAASRLANQAVGDALGDLLLVAALLLRTTPAGRDAIEQWAALYDELPSRQGKVSVRDRTVIRTTADETRAVAPAGLQEAIDAACARVGAHARAFVRPSGTEDIVRTYAEASTRGECDALEAEVARIVAQFCSA